MNVSVSKGDPWMCSQDGGAWSFISLGLGIERYCVAKEPAISPLSGNVFPSAQNLVIIIRGIPLVSHYICC